MLTIPKILEQIDYTNKPLDYKWTEKEINRFYPHQVKNTELLDKICELNYKAAFGLASAAHEWICWRFRNWRPQKSGKTLDIGFKAMEAHWLGQIDKYYLRIWKNDAIYKDLPDDNLEPPYWVANALMSDARFNYTKMRPTLYGNTTRMIGLTRYLSTERKLFDSWFTDCFERARKLFPNKQWPIGEELSHANMDKDYDSNNDLFIPREFFFTEGFDYETADLHKMQQELIEKVDYEANILLAKPEKMIEDGFQGTPYKYELK